MMPKNMLIVLLENHNFMNLERLSKEQRLKLIKMYASVQNIKNEVERYGKSIRATKKRLTTMKGVIGPQDWYMREFSRETMQYFKTNMGKDKEKERMTLIDKKEKVEEALEDYKRDWDDMLLRVTGRETAK